MNANPAPSASSATIPPRTRDAASPGPWALAALAVPWTFHISGVLAPALPLGTLRVPMVALVVALAPAVALYRRLTREDVLGSPTRRSVLAALRDDPGTTVAAVSRRLDLDYKTVAHHVRVLGEFGLANPRPDGRLRRWYPAGLAPRRAPAPLGHAPATALKLLRIVLEEPGVPQAEVARRLGVTPSTVCWHVGNLVEAGVLAPTEGRPGLRVAEDATWVRDALPDALGNAAA